MKTLILITCLLEITLQAPTAQQTEGHEPASVEIFLPHGYLASDIRRLLPAVAQGNPVAAGQNGFPGYASIEYLVPVGDPAQHSGIPAHLRHMLPPQAYVKEKHLHPSHRVSHDTGNLSPSQHVAPREASIEMIMPHGFQGQQLLSMPSAQGYIKHEIPQPPGAPSVEVMYPIQMGHRRSDVPAAKSIQGCHQNPSAP
ncbi:secretory calcium-binding phosphoprotein 7 [Conger conger]|uniref:secretory calcium-binding phosphoprotein 7 n=1 Tax=Conger conger TaxID=82655 RepID=UPI002A5AAC4F|nr:secretory calcium-binding phosphoprotein 7 [Conger conger]